MVAPQAAPPPNGGASAPACGFGAAACGCMWPRVTGCACLRAWRRRSVCMRLYVACAANCASGCAHAGARVLACGCAGGWGRGVWLCRVCGCVVL